MTNLRNTMTALKWHYLCGSAWQYNASLCAMAKYISSSVAANQWRGLWLWHLKKLSQTLYSMTQWLWLTKLWLADCNLSAMTVKLPEKLIVWEEKCQYSAWLLRAPLSIVKAMARSYLLSSTESQKAWNYYGQPNDWKLNIHCVRNDWLVK